MLNRTPTGRKAVAAGRWTAALLLMLGTTACNFFDDLLEVEAPDRVLPTSLDDPVAAQLLIESTVADFECAFADYILAAGNHGDEFGDSQLLAIYYQVDQRQSNETGGYIAQNPCASGRAAILVGLQTARWQGDETARKLEGWTDAEVANRQEGLATVYAHAGYAVLLLGESYCTMAFDLGPELNSIQIFTEAESRFTNAITAARAAGSADLESFALVGRARARLNLAKWDGGFDAAKLAEAGADAQLVPPGFVRNATYSDTPNRRYNRIWWLHNVNELYTIEPDFRNLTVEGVPDTRVPVIDAGHASLGDRATASWHQMKYLSLSTPIPIARYAEAQLILAEAQGGAAAVAIVDALRAGHGLPPYSGGTSAVEIQDLINLERSRELFLESQHLGDWLRNDLAFTPPPGTIYPVPRGGEYGSTRCLPLPIQETQNNPTLR